MITSTSQPTLSLAAILRTGSIGRCFIPDFKKDKFFLTLHHGTPAAKAAVFYLNSDNPYQNDLIFGNADFPCLPPNKTGQTIVSCGSVSFLTHAVLMAQNPVIVGSIPKATAATLYNHCLNTVNSYSARERAYVLATVQAMC